MCSHRHPSHPPPPSLMHCLDTSFWHSCCQPWQPFYPGSNWIPWLLRVHTPILPSPKNTRLPLVTETPCKDPVPITPGFGGGSAHSSQSAGPASFSSCPSLSAGLCPSGSPRTSPSSSLGFAPTNKFQIWTMLWGSFRFS